MVSVEYDGWVASGRGFLAPGDRSGFGIVRDGLDKFSDTAERRSTATARDSGHGEFWLGGHLAGLIRGVSGVAFAPSHAEVAALRDDLARLYLSDEYRRLIFRSEAGTRWAWAQTTSSLVWEHRRWGRPRAEFQVLFRCPDPWWLGETRSVSIPARESGELVNRGLAEAWPVAEVHGPINSGWELLGFRVDRAVAAGEVVTVDSETGRVSSSRAGELMEVASGFPTAIPPGVAAVDFRASGTGRAVVTVTDRYP